MSGTLALQLLKQLADLRFPRALRVERLAPGVLMLSPNSGAHHRVILSAGIHGNETAPVEILLQLLIALSRGHLSLSEDLLVIFGNLPAICHFTRYIDQDLNRLFGDNLVCGSGTEEQARAAVLKQAVADFFTTSEQPRYHFDLHCSIRESRYQSFALLPVQPSTRNTLLYPWLKSMKLEALVKHAEPAATFSQYTATYWQAASCTLELGKIRPLGHNLLANFSAISLGLARLCSGLPPLPVQRPIKIFNVQQTVIKSDPSFQLHLTDQVKNFTWLAPGFELASQQDRRWLIEPQAPYVLFPNQNVALGQRACLLLSPPRPLTEGED